MPHKVYHGRTGVIWNVTKRAVGVEVNKQVHMQASLPGIQQQAIPIYGRPECSLVHRRMSLQIEMTDLTLPVICMQFIPVVQVKSPLPLAALHAAEFAV